MGFGQYMLAPKVGLMPKVAYLDGYFGGGPDNEAGLTEALAVAMRL